MILLSALAMSVGWGFRGNYGHEAGAMIPGALLGLSISLTSRRPDWQARGVTLAFLGAIGFAFGGQMSYGLLVGYSMHTDVNNVHYAYWCIFLVGALWGGIGAGIMALGLTEKSETLDRWCLPLVLVWLIWTALDFTGMTAWISGNQWLHDPARAAWLKDSDWVAALSALLSAGLSAYFFRDSRGPAACIAWLASGWLIGFFVLVGVFHLNMSPPRSDNWAGCVGLFIAFCSYLVWQKNRAALYLLAWGFLAGGFGFAIGELFNVLGRGYWGIIGAWAFSYRLNSWKWMEQGFGFIMGAIIAIGALGLRRGRLAIPAEFPSKNFDFLALVYLLVIMMWENLRKNLRTWNNPDHPALAPKVFGIENEWWILAIALLLSLVVIVALVRQNQGRIQLTPPGVLGRIRWLFLLILWIAMAGDLANALPNLKEQGRLFVHFTLLLTAGLCSLIVVSIPEGFALLEDTRPATDSYWKTRWIILTGVVLVPPVLYGLTWSSVNSHTEPLKGSHLRFGPDASGTESPP
jgi:hypothetical protein